MGMSDLDRQIEQLKRCELLMETEKALYLKAMEILVKESNVQCVDAPVTACRLQLRAVPHHEPLMPGWCGVGCDATGRVVTLRLRGLGLGGGLDKLNFAAFPALTELDLNGNYNLNGTIPASISRLSSLELLDLGINGFNGSIPSEFGDLSGLIELRLYNNNLVDAIPHQLSLLPKIVHFDLGSNYLTDLDYANFPEFILKSGNITYLDVSSNTLFGPLPESLPEKLPNIRYLNLSANGFSGRILPSFGKLTKLQDLLIAANKLIGGVPEFLGSMTQLRILEIGEN
ncbi:hypothetical protein ABZP36_011318 [Zizania latifolia]